MRAERGRSSRWDRPHWPPQAGLLASAVAPVVVGTGVATHFSLVPFGRSLGALGVALALGLGLEGLRRSPGDQGLTRVQVLGWPALRQIPRSTVAWLAGAGVLGVWLAATTAWWLLALGALGCAAALVVARPSATTHVRGLEPLLALAAAELLAGWGTVLVELGRLPWLGLVAAILPASLAAAIWLLARIRDLPTDPGAGRLSSVAALSEKGSRTLFHGLLVLSLAVPLLITVPGLDGAECFLPWLLAPLAEGPLRNSSSADPALRVRAVRQLQLLLAASSVLLAVGIWAG